MLKYSLGIDVSKKDLHACLSVIDAVQQVKVQATRKFTNQLQGFKELHLWINKHRKQTAIPLIVVMESTGVYYEEAALFFHKAGYDVAIVLPNKAKKYLQALGLKTKNDHVDAEGLARMGAQQCLDLWTPMDEFFYELRALTRHHQGLHEMKTSVNNQLHATQHSIYSNKEVVKQLKKLIATMDKQIKDTEKRIQDHLNGTAEVAEKTAHLMAIKGMGLMSIATVLAETNGFTLFSSIGQLVSYAGYDVVENQSGIKKGKTRISKKGNSRIRRVLHMPAFNVVRYNTGNFKQFFDRLISRQNQKMKAYVAVQKKLLVLIYTLWRKNEPFSFNGIQRAPSGDKEAVSSFA
jgi:transposase